MLYTVEIKERPDSDVTEITIKDEDSQSLLIKMSQQSNRNNVCIAIGKSILHSYFQEDVISKKFK